MKIAICFFGELGFLDKFMIQNYIRCVIAPIQKYNRESVDFFYFLHTFFDADVFTSVENLRLSFPFLIMSFHDKKMALCDENKNQVETQNFIEDYSIYRVKKMWKRVENIDIVVYIRLDILLTKPLTYNDVELILKKNNHFFINNEQCPNLQRGLVIGKSHIMSVYADRIHYLADGGSFIDIMRSQHNMKAESISVVFVRVLKDGMVHPSDHNICPYIGDLISSSSTKIRLVKRKNSLNK
jgi:hypothetical protein